MAWSAQREVEHLDELRDPCERLEQFDPANHLRQVRAQKDPNEDEPSLKPRRYKPLDFGFLMVPDVVERTPAFIDSIQIESAAAKVGLKPDDLVLFINDELIQSCRALQDAIGRLESGDQLRLIVRAATNW